ncbi:DUF262 domain-containing protein [Empedobacter stercoris]|uniref:DUF262 domain-containing protein n=1 Tax=Empedobacter stercoris TaxID=1628248 RepID=UPI0016622530|nr:DUF262 domain-containing protein [Empedobacter stercoris]MCA4810600.1 DUF262 domain-containing protein [Empedobacter stercoris]QNT13399.1 DUF262 domain-containing protein [Empedobacter stercoris]
MKLPEPQSTTFTGLISDIEKGQIKIPQFQREFVWDIRKSANLMDSIIKGYPIGTFILWKTKERLRSVRDIGNFSLPEPAKGDFVNFVLDGQQRLTSLFASLKGLKIVRDNLKIDDYSEMYINLKAGEDDQIVYIEKDSFEENSYIKITDLLYGGLTLLASFPAEYLAKLEEYKKRIESYLFSLIIINDAPLEIATEIFTRINVGGKPLTLFEIMVAKTYDEDLAFDLSSKYKELIEKLRPLNYETVSDATVLQSVAIILSGECTKNRILKLEKNNFIEIWDGVTDAIERTIEYFISYYRIPVSQLLPYNALIVPYTYFFYKHKDKPTGDKQKYLQDYFWRCALSSRFSSGVEGKLAQDIKKIDSILNNELPKYEWAIDISKESILKNGAFSAGRSYIKSILCIYAYQQPQSFIDGSIVNISNYWLKQANSKNYHHFFPKAFLKKKGEEDFYINHIANITIVDDYLNKREIGAKAPSVYMKKFIKNNDDINSTMRTHLIDIENDGVLDNDFDLFLKNRILAIHKEFKKRIIEQDSDKIYQPSIVTDLDEEINEL